MALIKYSALVTGMSGKINGSVAARNKGGDYLRNKTTPVNPQTPAQQLARAQFGGVSSQWRSLTPRQVDAWNDAAGNFPYTNIFGDKKFLNGLQLFTQLNFNLTLVGTANIAEPPIPEGAGSIVLSNVNFNATTTSISLVYDNVEPSSATRLVLEATRTMVGNTRFYKNSFVRITTINDPHSEVPTDTFDAYVAVFGTPIVGGNVAFRISAINNATGERTVGSVMNTVIVS